MAREIIHVGLGSSACATSAHYLNLQGLSVTTSSSNVDENGERDSDVQPTCNPSISHTTTFQGMLVPRALLIDQTQSLVPHEPSDLSRETAKAATTGEKPEAIISRPNSDVFPSASPLSLDEARLVEPSNIWSGSVERINWSGNDLDHNSQMRLDPRMASFQKTAQQLAFAADSRYRSRATTSPEKSYAVSSDQRTVDWDNLSEEEEDDDDEEEEQERRARQQQQKANWNQQVYPQLQGQLDSFWADYLGAVPQESTPPIDVPPNENCPDETAEEKETKAADFELSWRDFWMPPRHPNSILDLPFSAASGTDHYYPVSQNMGSEALREWSEDDFLDRIRRMLEDCDSCQGVTIASSGHGVYAGLTTQLLHYLKDDCPGARRFVWAIQDDSSLTPEPQDAKSNPSWRTQHIERTRLHMEMGLQWQDYLEASHAILSLQLPQGRSLFSRSSVLAAALETATLPIHLQSSGNTSRSRIGLNSYYYGNFSGDSPFGSASNLSLGEFMNNLQPAPGLSVLELDTLLPETTSLGDQSLWSRLLEGTSLERDQRMKYQPQLTGNRRPRDVSPGLWMQEPKQGGILSSLSPHGSGDRSVHTHFALASSLRTPQATTTAETTAMSSTNHVDCMMQGMGIRYRPEQSLATHVGESLSNLTSAGYGAGSYWKHTWGTAPVLSVLGNTTRFFAQASRLGVGVKEALSPRSRGVLNRDVSNEILPEMDNCHEVLSSLYKVRDAYQPPRGSGLTEDEDEGLFFD